ncbi:MAG: ABC transporter substrate-binding protein [Rhizobiaceae bacterium]
MGKASDSEPTMLAISRRNMLRLGLVSGAMFMSAGSLAFGQDGSPKRGGTLTIGADADPIGLDPVTLTAYSSMDFTALIYSGLLRWTPDMEIEPDLAVSYEQPDATTYVFRLREGVKFHNGQHFSADDVKHTFDRIMDPASNSRLRSYYANVAEVTVVDPYTVEFKLSSPDAAFLRFLATNPDGVIVPKGVEGLTEKPVGTGPFVFESYQPGQQFTLSANKGYYEEGQPYLDTVVFKFYRDQATLTSALRSKAVDMTWLKDPRVAAQVAKTSPDLVSAPGQTSRTFPVWINLKEGPLTDVRVRRALSLATNRELCVQVVLGGSGKVGAMLPESHVGGYDGKSELPYYGVDVEGARALLAEAGYPDGIDLGEYIVVAANALDVACAQLLQQQWAAAGIRVQINPMETAPLLAHWNEGTFGTLLSVALSWSADADAILQRIAPSSQFGAALGIKDDELDKMIDMARAEIDPAARAELHDKIQRLIADNVYVLQVYQYPLRWELWWNYVDGYEPLAANIRSYVRTTWRND